MGLVGDLLILQYQWPSGSSYPAGSWIRLKVGLHS